MTPQRNLLRHRLANRKKTDVQLLLRACSRLDLTELEVQHLCRMVFTLTYADDALDAFLKFHGQGERRGDEYLLSLIPPRAQPLEDHSEGFLAWLFAPLRMLGRLLS